MGWFARLFGNNGTVKFKGVLTDGRSLDGKIEIESFGYTKEELEEKIKKIIYSEVGLECTSLKIIGFLKT